MKEEQDFQLDEYETEILEFMDNMDIDFHRKKQKKSCVFLSR